jgi:hypothetical protein
MSTQDSKTKSGDSVIEEHYCIHEGCNKWGGFGYSASAATAPLWWCWEHYPHKPEKNKY